MAQERRRPEPHPWNIISRVSPSFSWLAGAKRQREREREREEEEEKANKTTQTRKKAQPRANLSGQERSEPHHPLFSFTSGKSQATDLYSLAITLHSSL
jgi:hypothetical protein